ncbi:MAG TPA: hypothetical protein V6C72_14490, partial [Chroococcales cyanobacterium]
QCNLDKAIAYLTSAADSGLPGSARLLFQIYSDGKLVPANFEKAFHWQCRSRFEAEPVPNLHQSIGTSAIRHGGRGKDFGPNPVAELIDWSKIVNWRSAGGAGQ